MKLVLQRVKEASCTIDNKLYSKIDYGYLIYLGIHPNDTKDDVVKYVKKVLNLRILEDNVGKMNLSIDKEKHSILLVSQFTLYGNSTKGNRPSFIEAARPEVAIPLYELFVELLSKEINVKTGVFGADMLISSQNDGPVTIILENL